MEVIHDVDRPDVNGVAPKMQAIADQAKETLKGLLPHLQIVATDNLGSSVTFRGSFDPKEEWSNKIFMNSKHFIIHFFLAKGKRYYEEGDKVKIEFSTGSDVSNFRGSTTTPEKAIERIRKWIVDNQ